MKSRFKYLLFLIFFFAGYFIYSSNINNETADFNENDPEYIFFQEKLGKEIKYAARADINDDGKDDYVVIWYEPLSDHNFVSAVSEGPDGYKVISGSKAPFENLKIEFKDIDEKPPVEFIVYGSRDGNHGYIIYRCTEGKIINLFGEGAEVC